MANRKCIDLIPVPSALGAPDKGVAQGPEALRLAGLEDTLLRCGWRTHWGSAVAVPTGERWQALRQVCDNLTQRVEKSMAAGHRPLVLGGDHAIATGTWRGVARHVGSPAQPFGLIWLDAHLDAHTPEDSLSANPHGMPVALLLGDGDQGLAHPWLAPSRICLVGGRSWELPEHVRLERFGVHVFDHKYIASRGIEAVLKEAIDIASLGTTGFGLSIDLDVFDPSEAPGVNSPAADGASSAAWLPLLKGLAARDDCLAVEIVEYDPTRDPLGITSALACHLTKSLYSAKDTD
ncbi:MAG TPA: arginase [Rhodocyclaceae bacterium]|nr:arginase [Rhodocyclaceae bacterium]